MTDTAVAIGDTLAHYLVTGKLGEGGMGVVYRARDERLERDVAIKVLPAAFAADAERLARFAREARLLAQLHHPSIASIFGLEEAGGTRALVMELVDGEDLAARIARGPLPVEDALQIAKQIADALEAAHGQGIVHRDLKPANVKLRPDGAVKVLDFGLAKALDAEADAGAAPRLATSPTLAHSPTITAHRGTQLGVILGTAAYMAPEQARGLGVDRRADIWAFGVVLWEMLAGRRLFAGELVSDVLADVLKQEIDWSALPPATPLAIRQLLRRCLERNPRNRLHDVADARIVVEEVIAGKAEEPTPAPTIAPAARRDWLHWLPWAIAAALGALVVSQLVWRRDVGASTAVRSLEIAVPSGYLLDRDAPPALSPDGNAVVFGASSVDGGSRLFLRPLDRFESRPLEGTDGGNHPFWSPDSQAIGFFRATDFTLRRYDLATRTTQIIAKTGAQGRGGSWGEDGTILFTPGANDPIQRVAATGGVPADVTVVDRAILDGSHRFPVWLPDGRHFLFTLWSNNVEAAARVGGVYVGSVDKGPIRRLTPDLSPPVLAGRDRLLALRDGSLVALRLDPDKLTVAGFGETITDQPLHSPASGALAVSASAAGDIAYAVGSGEGTGQLSWLDRRGAIGNALGFERMPITALAASPDGQRFAVGVAEASGGNVLVADVDRQLTTRLTRGTLDFTLPVWSPDGTRVAFMSQGAGSESIYVEPADGSRPAELLLTDKQRDFQPNDWSAHGNLLLLSSKAKSSLRRELWVYDVGAGRPRPLLTDPSADLTDARLSPDGRWLAYRSDEAGNPEIFIRPFPALDRKWQVSRDGGQSPHWRADGRELIFLATADRAIYAVSVDATGPAPVVGSPELLFAPRSPLLGFAPTADHARFLAGVVPPDLRSEPIRVVLGWRAAQGGKGP